MSVRLAVAERYIPGPLRRRGLDELAAAAAAGFGCQLPPWCGKGYAERLAQFARFSAEQATAAYGKGREAAVREALRWHAERLGGRLRRRLGVRSHQQGLRALTVLYRQIGIHACVREGGVEVTRCSFSSVYDAAVCHVMSAMDEGICAGLTGGRELVFTMRITEGAPRCVAWVRGSAGCAPSS